MLGMGCHCVTLNYTNLIYEVNVLTMLNGIKKANEIERKTVWPEMKVNPRLNCQVRQVHLPSNRLQHHATERTVIIFMVVRGC